VAWGCGRKPPSPRWRRPLERGGNPSVFHASQIDLHCGKWFIRVRKRGSLPGLMRVAVAAPADCLARRAERTFPHMASNRKVGGYCPPPLADEWPLYAALGHH
jgi:hypothetical protein